MGRARIASALEREGMMQMQWRAQATRGGILIMRDDGESMLLSWSAVFALLARRPRKGRRNNV
jgi:hypothetical protein